MNYALMADLLEESKQYLWKGRLPWTCLDCVGVCSAVKSAAAVRQRGLWRSEPQYVELEVTAKEFRRWVWKATDELHSVDSWLRAKGCNLDNVQLQEYRLLWIDQMIAILRGPPCL